MLYIFIFAMIDYYAFLFILYSHLFSWSFQSLQFRTDLQRS